MERRLLITGGWFKRPARTGRSSEILRGESDIDTISQRKTATFCLELMTPGTVQRAVSWS
ncbi:hypothetical protein J6590_039028 [Homalodisca vitripennis]|nr:hypothetical protein J6590_039028 [Homalodisca vitripennis]